MRWRRYAPCEQWPRACTRGGTMERSRQPQHTWRARYRPMDASTAAGRRQLYRRLAQRQQPGSGTALAVMRARTWTYPVPNLQPVIGVPYAITGGVATRLYMQERVSDDLDIIVRPDDEERVSDDLRRSGAVRLRGHPSGGTHWLLPEGAYLDVLTLTASWVDEALAHPRRALDGQPVVDLPYLVVMKLLSCWGHDIGDLARLVGDLDDEALAPIRDAVARHAPDAADDLEWLIESGRLEYVAPIEG